MGAAVHTGAAAIKASYKRKFGPADKRLLAQLEQHCDAVVSGNEIEAHDNGQPFRLRIDTKQGTVILTIETNVTTRFKITRKHGFERVLERVLPARRVTSYDAQFDTRFTLHTRTPRLPAALLRRKAVRQAVVGFFAAGARSLHCAPRRLALTLRRDALGEDPCSHLLDNLEDLRWLGQEMQRWAKGHELEPVTRDIASLVVGTTLTVLGATGFAAMIIATTQYSLVRVAPFALLACAVSLFAVTLACVAIAMAMRERTAPSAPVLAFSSVATLAVSLPVMAGLMLANGGFDRGPKADHVDTICCKRVSRNKNNVTHYVGVDATWNSGKRRWLRVSKSAYESTTAGSHQLSVTVAPGALGFPWIARYRVIAPPGG